MTDIFLNLKERLPIEWVLNSYGVQLRGNRCKCPVHHGEHLSAGVRNNKLHCFKCNQTWDAVGLVSELDGISPLDAAKQLNDQYALGLSLGQKTTSAGRRREREVAAIRREQQTHLKEAFRQWENHAWIVFSSRLRQLRQDMKDYSPDANNNGFHPLYVEACRDIDRIEWFCDVLHYGTAEEKMEFFRNYRNEVKVIEKQSKRRTTGNTSTGTAS